MFFRILFASLLLGSTIIVQLKENSFPPDKSFIVLHGLIVIIFLLSIYYAFIFRTVKKRLLFPYFQIGIDTLLVTLIIFITGSFTSIFSFLYLVVIIYSSMIIFRKGSMIMASFCSIQYGIMINLEYYGIIDPYFLKESGSIGNYAWNLVFFKVLITMVACFAVAFLSGLLSEQLRRTKKELSVMEERVERVERMAYLGEIAAGMTHEIKNPQASLNRVHFNPNIGRKITYNRNSAAGILIFFKKFDGFCQSAFKIYSLDFTDRWFCEQKKITHKGI